MAPGTATTTVSISFGTNTKVVKNPPKSWEDLLKPEYKGQVAIDNNPGMLRATIWLCLQRCPRKRAAPSTTSCRASRFFQHLKEVGNLQLDRCQPVPTS